MIPTTHAFPATLLGMYTFPAARASRQNSRRKKLEGGSRSEPPRALSAACSLRGPPGNFSAGSFAARAAGQDGARKKSLFF